MVRYAVNFGASSRLQFKGALLLGFPYRDYGRMCLSVVFCCFYISESFLICLCGGDVLVVKSPNAQCYG